MSPYIDMDQLCRADDLPNTPPKKKINNNTITTDTSNPLTDSGEMMAFPQYYITVTLLL